MLKGKKKDAKKEDAKKEDAKKEEGKKEDVKKKDAKKKGDKKAAGEKSEESPVPTTDSSSTVLPEVHIESVSEETQAIPEVKEPPAPPPPPFHEEPLLVQVIIESYEGKQVDEFYEGEGFVCFKHGDTYKGLFSEGRMNGQGVYTWADGVKYEGTFVKNVLTVNGCYTWNDGSVYEGSIKDGLRHGFGFFRSGTRPISYLGDWCNGKRHGKGIIYYDQEHSSWYSGEWVNNVREGWGVRRYRSGNVYEGQWEKNVRHGHGKMTWVTANQEYIGQWSCGIQHGSGKHTWLLKRMSLSQYPLQNEYVGDFVQGERHGQGMFVYAGGSVYTGEWAGNKKHGKGRFVFKNGQIFEGEFVDDLLVKCPAHPGAAVVETKKHGHISRRRRGTKRTTVINAVGKTSILGADIELEIAVLLELFLREDRAEELKQVELAVLRHISKLREVYQFYSQLGCARSLDGTYVLTKLQFWRFLKDCEFHHFSLTLAEMDRLLGGNKPVGDIHCPHEIILFRTFLSYLVHLAFHMYHEEYKDEAPHLNKCFLELMSWNVLPCACHVQGIFFSGERFTFFASCYIDKCWEIYRDFCRPRPRPPFEPTVRMRQFLWMLDDLKLFNEQLTVPKLLEIFVKVGASLHDINEHSSANLDLELVFLEFFEALLECALVCVTDDMIPEQVVQDNRERNIHKIKGLSKETSTVSLYSEYSLPQPPRPHEDRALADQPSLLETLLTFPSTPGESKDDVSLLNEDVKKEQGSCPVKELTDEAKEDKDEQEEELSLWMSQVQTFFTTKLFPAFQHEMELREEVKSKKEQDAELAVLRKMEAEELARRIAEKEEEEVRRREAAAALKALASQSVTPKGKQRRKEGSAKKDPSRKGLSAKKGDLPKKEAPKQEPSAKKEPKKAAKPAKERPQKASADKKAKQ